MNEKTKPRKIKNVGGSLTLIIPKNVGLEDGDYVSVDQVANSSTVLLSKVVREGDTQHQQEMVEREPQIKIERIAVVGFVVTQVDNGFYARPLIGHKDGFVSSRLDDPLDAGEKVVGVIPSPQNTFTICVHGCDLAINLGYEFAGASNPNWEELYLTKKREQDAKNSEPVEGDILAE